MNTIETFTGDVNLRNGSAKCNVFHAPHAGGHGVEERPLGLAAKSGQTSAVIVAVSPYPVVTPSVQGYSQEIGGKMVRMTYAVADGEILKIFAQRRPGAGKVPVNACQFIRCRESAALREVEIKLLTDASVNEPFGKVRGRFDLITLEEAKAYGVSVNPNFDRMFSEGAVAATMTNAIIAPEAAAIKQVVHADGTATAIVTAKRRRFLNVGKPPAK